ncbi:MAG TPA: AAA family ATPase [Opitutaceae bacterium]|jgi:MoxR-like ATPase|nr:AAA family ATPase [Opitutaceae bacterium]
MKLPPSSAEFSRPSATEVERLRELPGIHASIMEQLGRRVVGHEDIKRNLIVALLAGGHSLLIGVPGLAKTLLVRSLADATDLRFRRIQFTPDLMPSDITGSEVLEEGEDRRRAFRFVAGPLFAQLILADEINRAPAKTQSALLEAMEERSVTTAGTTRALPSPFFVLATQNPIEQEGTYPLPEAQLDRFLFSLHLGYPSPAEEANIVHATTGAAPPELVQVCSAEVLLGLQQAVRQVHLPGTVAEYAVRLVQSTRPETEAAPGIVKKCVRWGAGPRATQSLVLAAKVIAALDGRLNCAAEDIPPVAPAVLRHRLVLNYRAEADRIEASHVIAEVIRSVER